MPIDPRDLLPPELRSTIYLAELLGHTSKPPSYAPSPSDEILSALGSGLLVQTWDGGEAVDTTAAGAWSAWLGSQGLQLMAFILRETAEVSGMLAYVITAFVGTANLNNKMGIYRLSDDGNFFDKVAETPNDGNLWKTAGVIQKNFSSSIALDPGLYFAAMLYCASVQTTQPKLLARSTGNSTLVNPAFAGQPYRAGSVPLGPTADLFQSIAVVDQTAGPAPFWAALV